MKKQLISLSILALFAVPASAGVIFEQDFSSSTTVTDYVNATATPANTTQFGALVEGSGAGLFAISSGALTLDRTAVGYATNRLSRGNMDGASLLSMTFDMSAVSANYTQNGTEFLIGKDTSADNPLGSYANRFVFLAFTGVDGDGFTMTASGGSTSAKVSIGSTDQWAVFCNNTAAAESYAAPDGSTGSVAPYSYDLWVGNTMYFNDEAKYASFSDAFVLSAFRLSMGKNDDAMWTFDNIKIQNDLNVIPEPATMGLVALGGLGLLRRKR